MLIRCSALPKIMTAPRSKSEVLSETAKSYLKQIAKEDFYGYSSELSNKYIQKGLQMENDSIDLLNSVLFTSYEKNTERINTDVLTGEADIVTDDCIIDVKTSWSLDTFPALPSDINPSDYEWQLRGYMHLYEKQFSKVAYCMVDTPSELCTWENPQLHEVSYIDPTKRVTIIEFERDLEKEVIMIERVGLAISFYLEYINELNNK